MYFRDDSDVVVIRYRHPDHPKPIVTSLKEIRRDVLGEDEAKRQARVVLDQILTDIANGVTVSTGPLTVEQWFTKRVPTRTEGKKELAMMRKHGQALMRTPLRDITPAMLGAWVKSLTGAPRSIWHRWSNLRKALFDAVIAGHIPHVPPLPPGSLPERVDADPEWRDGARYTLAEVEALITDERIPLNRRVLYALKALTGGRHGEAVGLRWDRIDWTATPRPKIILSRQYDERRTKTKATKIVPMHPALEAVLTAWRAHLAGTGIAVGLDDYIIPTAGVRVPRRPHSSDSNPELAADLRTLGLRVRDGHDFRATFISEIFRSGVRAGVPEYILESLTHRRAATRNAIEDYKRGDYELQCAAIMSLRIRTLRSVEAVAQVASGSDYGSATVAEKSSDSSGLAEPVVMTVLANDTRHTLARTSKSTQLRIVAGTSDAQEPASADSDRSTVAATVPAPASPSGSDPRIDALEAAARALLAAIETFRK